VPQGWHKGVNRPILPHAATGLASRPLLYAPGVIAANDSGSNYSAKYDIPLRSLSFVDSDEFSFIKDVSFRG
jgi:hypothetical protein